MSALKQTPTEAATSELRNVRLFRNGANQAVRIPKEWELPGNDAVMHREGDRIIIERAPSSKPEKGTLAALTLALEKIALLGPIDEEWPEIEDPPAEDVNL
jgi:antitoxin VapB